MDSSEEPECFNRAVSDQLYQLLVDLNSKGASDIRVDPRKLLSSEYDAAASMQRSAALEKEAKDILNLFTNAPITPVFREAITSNTEERAVVPGRRTLTDILKPENFKIDIWRNELLPKPNDENENCERKAQPSHFIHIEVKGAGNFLITGLENINEDIRDIIRELTAIIDGQDAPNFTVYDNNSVQISEINEEEEKEEPEVVEISLPNGVLKFTTSENPLDILMQFYPWEETDDNKKIFKVPELGDFVVSQDDDPITVFKTITGYDLTDFYNKSSENTSTESPEVDNNIENTAVNRSSKKKNTKSRRCKKNKRKSKKRK